MRTHILVLLSFATSILGYKIISPNATKGWTNSGPQSCTWQWDSSDALNFTALLSNTDTNFYSQQVLSALVNGSDSSTTFRPPGEGWPVGDNFYLSFVKDINDLSTLFAKSDEFSIEIAPQSSNTSAIPTSTSSPTVVTTPPHVIATTPTAQTTAVSQATGVSNGAHPRNDVRAALMSVFGFVGLALVQSFA